MWLFLNNAYLSIVAHWDMPDHLLVRSRFPDDINRVFPDAKAEHTPRFDYPYRTILPRTVVAEVMAAEIGGIDYGNFKNSVSEHDRHDRYYRVYNAMLTTRQNWYDSQPVLSGFDCDAETGTLSLG